MQRLRIEAITVAAGDRRHPRAEAADDDRWGRVGPRESCLTRPQAADERDGVDDVLCAGSIVLDRLADCGLLAGIRRAATAAGAEPEQQSSVRDRLERRGHVREHARM